MVIPHRHNIPLPQPASQPVTWRHILGVPVTWAATKRARAGRPPQSPPRPPIARAHVRAHPHPTWGLRRRCRRRSRRLQPTPLPALGSKSGSQSRWYPGFPPPPFSLPRVWPPARASSDCSPFARSRAPRATRGGAVAVAALYPRHGTCWGGRRRKLDSGAAALPGGSPPPAPATSRSTSGSFRSPPLSLGRAGGGGSRRAHYTACW